MSANLLVSVIDRVEVQLQNIDGSGDYNFSLSANEVVQGFELWNNAISYPSIYIANVWEEESEATDQRTFEIHLYVELFGYVQKTI